MQNDYLFWRKGEFCGVQSIRYGAMFQKEVNIIQSLQCAQNTTKIHNTGRVDELDEKPSTSLRPPSKQGCDKSFWTLIEKEHTQQHKLKHMKPTNQE